MKIEKKGKRLPRTTEIRKLASSFIKNVPIHDYTREDFYESGAAEILGRLRLLVNQNALTEPKGTYDKGLQDGLLWAWETVAELFVLEGDTLETLGVKRA